MIKLNLDHVLMPMEFPRAAINYWNPVSIKNYIIVNIVFKRYYMHMIKGAENE